MHVVWQLHSYCHYVYMIILVKVSQPVTLCVGVPAGLIQYYYLYLCMAPFDVILHVASDQFISY